MAIRMSLWGVEEVRANHVASSLSLFTFAAFGFLLGLVGIFIFKFNRKAYLKIDGGKIDARFGWGKEVHAELRELTNAEKNGRNLKLCTKDGIVWIYNLDNAKELCQYILARISKHYKPVDVEEAKLEYKITRKSYVKYLIATIAFGVLLFVNIMLETLLTKGKDLSEFSKFDTLTFAIFLVA